VTLMMGLILNSTRFRMTYVSNNRHTTATDYFARVALEIVLSIGKRIGAMLTLSIAVSVRFHYDSRFSAEYRMLWYAVTVSS
jgi:hypothetical protein